MPTVWPVSINSTGNMEHGALLWHFRGTLHVTLVLRTSYSLGAGPLTSIPADPVDDQDRHYGNHAAYPVRTANDLVPYLPRAEIVHAGAVVAPTGRTTVRLSLIRRGKPVFDKRSVALTNQPCPGLGPLSRRSAERLAFLRNAPEPQPGMDAIMVLPDHLDFNYYQCAPLDQQCSQIEGGDQILLHNLHPEQPELTITLPSRAPLARAYLGPEEAHLLLECKRVVLDTDRRRVTLNWYADIELPGPNAIPYLRVVATAPDGLDPSDNERTVRLSVPRDLWTIDDESTIDIGALRADAHLPFAGPKDRPSEPARAAPASAAATPWGKREAVAVPEVGISTVALKVPELPELPPLDFGPPPKAAAKPVESAPRVVLREEPPKAPAKPPEGPPRVVFREDAPAPAPPKAPPTPPPPPKAPAAAAAVHPKKGAYDRFKR